MFDETDDTLDGEETLSSLSSSCPSPQWRGAFVSSPKAWRPVPSSWAVTP